MGFAVHERNSKLSHNFSTIANLPASSTVAAAISPMPTPATRLPSPPLLCASSQLVGAAVRAGLLLPEACTLCSLGLCCWLPQLRGRQGRKGA